MLVYREFLLYKVKSAYEPSGSPGRSLSQFLSHEATRNFSTHGMLVHRRVTPSIKFAGTHLYTWVERGTVRVKYLAHEHNAISPARSRTRTARSGVERTNHEDTAPPPSSARPTLKYGDVHKKFNFSKIQDP